MAILMLLTQQAPEALYLAQGHKHISQPSLETGREEGGKEIPSLTNSTLPPIP